LTRGEGQGREVPADGVVVMELTDPFSLRDPLIALVSLPGAASLQFARPATGTCSQIIHQ
jgi:hypothetical protein